ncbi:MAG: hypothetical protein J6F30_17940 [Cellulosilyticum sp.]|nr:hypothetical protein [Cellulosilyticum sp.]
MIMDYRYQFLHPDKEFSPFPFWFWNDYLDKEEINRQIEAFKEKGIDGFVIHPRIGLPIEMDYLSDEFMEYVKFAVERASKLDMKVILYDEGMYPSGSANGKVVKANPNFASKGLMMTKQLALEEGDVLIATIDINQKTGERMVASPNDNLEQCERYYFIQTYSNGTIRGIHYGEDDGEENAPKSADLLNLEATQCFITHTHQRYYDCLAEHFGNTIIAMFTDEPSILGRCGKEGLIPWTDNFLEFYTSLGGKITDLPLLFEKEGHEQVKVCYKRAVNKLLLQNFYGPIVSWCHEHQIQLTGHPESSEDIGLLSQFDIPCQDIVWRFVAPEDGSSITGPHSTMGKCSSDAARHRNKLRNGNECCGCCSPLDHPYFFRREDFKWYLDWLFVRGVNMIIPHAFFYSMRELRKDERPPDVGMNSEFWESYHELSDYIKRMSQLLVESNNVTKIAILCTQDQLPWEIAKPLYENQIEFNYLEEELFTECTIHKGQLEIANQKYHILLVDDYYTYSKETEAYLEGFKAAGGIVLHTSAATVVEEIKSHTDLDFEIKPSNVNLRKTHIRKGEIDFILLTNEGEEIIVTEVYIKRGRIYEIWDAELGKVERLEQPTDRIGLSLDRRKSTILVMHREAEM